MLVKENLRLKAFGLLNVPMLAFASPKLVKLTDEEAVVRLPLNWRTIRRDLGSMYLGALAVGADVAAGIMAFERQARSGAKYSLVFKSLDSQFLKRPESDVLFRCADGPKIDEMLRETSRTGERAAAELTVTATCPKTSGDEPVASFKLVLTAKAKRAKS